MPNPLKQLIQNIVVIGGSRGIGFGFVKDYLLQGHRVHATYREQKPATALQQLQTQYPEQLRLIPLDVTDASRIRRLPDEIDGKVDVLILNAGIMLSPPGSHPLIESADELPKTMAVNVYGPDNVMRALFEKLMHPHSITAYISSTLSSQNDNLKGRWNAYRASKAAGNIIMQNWNIELATAWAARDHLLDNRPCAFPISPGLVQTDMAGGRGELTVEQSVSQMVKVINEVREHKRCSLYLFDGKVLQTYPEPTIVTESVEIVKKNSDVSLDTNQTKNRYSFHNPKSDDPVAVMPSSGTSHGT